ncbi:MAG: ABC transporter ATP-binding protein [Boseongicola sp. SB0676_bin_33]|uniref:ABC transporter ATP-binding protein n=1 Tax=Boseongicola sp. SB0664_bin_43 TaxID=2604844 RepID=A0A6B0XZR0_9RHOB|nr:ABC transporter ATP-binding protein [Boseongicola sp. SB0664_bin_43]MYF88294.1 ABC transporter ATP-binding protein [Boseongicola sp. SB0676_bin_33]MYK30278.1 ABC transporter ATP-binding protein [Boseongicola sp. SB0670_bin_30]
MLLDVHDLNKSFPGGRRPITVLDGVSMSLDTGEVVALTGESGSGKSTLLHVIAGLEPTDGGSVLFNGKDMCCMDDAGRAALRRNSIGVVFQQFNLIPSLSVGQNLAFHARLAGRGASVDLPTLATSLGLADHLAKFPEDLSGGEQQRVAIGRAIASEPKLVLADEPTGNLDETTGQAVFDLLLALSRRTEAALLIATHSMRLAEAADRRLHLSHGKLTE